jgi:hypothetical protein
MFCQNCGAELRLEQGFCAVCGVGAPRPVLRPEPEDRGNKPQRLNAQPKDQSAPDPRQIRSFQAIRQASGQRGGMRALAPTASLAVPASPPAPTLPQAAAMPAQAHQVWPAPEETPVLMSVSDVPGAQSVIQPYANGYYHASQITLGANGHTPDAASNGYAAPHASTGPLAGYAPQTRAASTQASGIRLPSDLPNRVALGALASMLLSFLLPWVIISGSRATPLSIGWPVLVPLALILAVALTILLPERTVYTRFILALPFAFGSFALGNAVVIFLVSSAIAANSVGTAFLGVDIGFVLFTLAACVLAAAGYFKLLRELPLLSTGQIVLAPLPGTLGRSASSPVQRVAAAQHSTQQQQQPTQRR